MIISIINIYNAKYLNTLYSQYYIKQFIWYIVSIILFLILQKINIKNIFKISYIFYILNIILLILVLIIGKEILTFIPISASTIAGIILIIGQ